ncbi:MAG: HAMP domain-containing histidine kinase [Bacteroidaceae bacterium]|nr:HAMP domain-containing histidine kinase [Bacteroidaceae bacterium]MBP9637113.1 HAMP domain-containing histidine kinase [Bacteroidaceae bacterium]
MYFWDRFRTIKSLLVIVALLLALAIVVASHFLIRDLRTEESKRMEIWADAMRSLNSADEHTDLTLVLNVLNNNATIPTIVRGREGDIQDFRNIDVPANAEENYLKNKATEFAANGRCIRIYLLTDKLADPKKKAKLKNVDYIDVLYDDSNLLKRLYYYPYIQLVVMLLYIAVAIMALMSLKRSEQNKVWVGLSKETAHQLGTPISSMMAWSDILRTNYPNDELIVEMDKDILRLQLVADRFSKIGSNPELQFTKLGDVLDNVIDYIQRRCSKCVTFERNYSSFSDCQVKLNPPLFEWVIEVLLKNAVDAMQGKGLIKIEVAETAKKICIDITDTGKGIPKSKLKTVFSPGYTTKSRGWGLGLSLAKRIIEECHGGSIFVRRSELNNGTTFRIELKK